MLRIRSGEIPITKNEELKKQDIRHSFDSRLNGRMRADMEKCIRVADMSGRIIGVTYPKRAKGLVKNGRASFYLDNLIRMNSSDPAECILEVSDMNEIFFNAKEWCVNPDRKSGMNAERTFINGFDGKLTEIYSLGNWEDSEVEEIMSKQFELPKNEEASFVFWLNGGENEEQSEVCQLNIIFDSDWENRNVYKLNRNFIKPLKKYKGWELYEIPFSTGDAEKVQFRFCAANAVMSVMHAESVESYAELKDEPDLYEDVRPQRHNIVFENGWPDDEWYSYVVNEENARKIRDNIKGAVSDFADAMADVGGKVADFGEKAYNKVKDKVSVKVKEHNEKKASKAASKENASGDEGFEYGEECEFDEEYNEPDETKFFNTTVEENEDGSKKINIEIDDTKVKLFAGKVANDIKEGVAKVDEKLKDVNIDTEEIVNDLSKGINDALKYAKDKLKF